MNNKKIGVLLIILALLLSVLFYFFYNEIQKQEDSQCSCMENSGFCPHSENNNFKIYFAVFLVSIMISLSIYLIFFEKSEKEIINTLKDHKKTKDFEEKFNILLKGLDEFEKKVIIAIKEQDGITQQTLRYRTDMHKSKLSIVLTNLENKDLIKRELKGKTKQVFIKFKL